MYELIILSLLMQGNAHGYLIIKVMNDISGPYVKLGRGRLYPLLAKLEANGLVDTFNEDAPEPVGQRTTRTYQITEKGRQRFKELMMDTLSNPGEYQKLFLYKVQGMVALSQQERLALLNHYINFCQSHILYLSKRAEMMEQGAINIPGSRMNTTLNVIQHATDQWRLEFAWAEQLLQKELKQGEEDTKE